MAKNKTLYFFDDEGHRWEVEQENVQPMIEEFLTEDLEIMYKSTRYFHELEMAKVELIELGILSQEQGTPYDAEAVLLAADAFATEIESRIGKKALEALDAEVDLTWQENKPDLSKYKKK